MGQLELTVLKSILTFRVRMKKKHFVDLLVIYTLIWKSNLWNVFCVHASPLCNQQVRVLKNLVYGCFSVIVQQQKRLERVTLWLVMIYRPFHHWQAICINEHWLAVTKIYCHSTTPISFLSFCHQNWDIFHEESVFSIQTVSEFISTNCMIDQQYIWKLRDGVWNLEMESKLKKNCSPMSRCFLYTPF